MIRIDVVHIVKPRVCVGFQKHTDLLEESLCKFIYQMEFVESM